MRVSNPDRLPLEIARDVWKRHAQAFFWVRPLARSARFRSALAKSIMIGLTRMTLARVRARVMPSSGARDF
jgi:hypothetical protein